MDVTSEQYKRIIHYLDAGMTLAEMDDFEKELAANPEMRQQLDFEQFVRDSFVVKKIKDSPAQQLSLGLTAKTDTEKTSKSATVSDKRIWFAIAVAASVFVAIITIVLVKKNETKSLSSTKRIDPTGIKKNAKPQIAITRTGNDSIKTLNFASLYKHYFVKDTLPETYPMLLANALTNYEDGDYTSIQKLHLSGISETRGMDAVNAKENILQLGHYYKGISFLETNNALMAITNLEWVIKNSTNKKLKYKAEWYLALAYLKTNTRDKAVQLLLIVSREKKNKLLSRQAQEVLKRMKQ